MITKKNVNRHSTIRVRGRTSTRVNATSSPRPTNLATPREPSTPARPAGPHALRKRPPSREASSLARQCRSTNDYSCTGQPVSLCPYPYARHTSTPHGARTSPKKTFRSEYVALKLYSASIGRTPPKKKISAQEYVCYRFSNITKLVFLTFRRVKRQAKKSLAKV